MKLQYDKQIKDNVLTSIIMFKEFGTQSMTAEQEKTYIEDYSPRIYYKDLTFSRRFKILNGDVVEDEGVIEYTNTLSIALPTNVIANPVTTGTANVTIGTKVIVVNIADKTNGIATASEIETAVLGIIKTDASILALYSTSDITSAGGHIVGIKKTSSDSSVLIKAINLVFGKDGVIATNTTIYKDSVLVSIALNNKEIVINETLLANFIVDVKSIEESEINSVLNSKEIVAQAKCELFKVVVKDAIKAKLEELRLKINHFEGEELETI